jgi:hypothetical protein
VGANIATAGIKAVSIQSRWLANDADLEKILREGKSILCVTRRSWRIGLSQKIAEEDWMTSNRAPDAITVSKPPMPD